jgi:hypothetical protein
MMLQVGFPYRVDLGDVGLGYSWEGCQGSFRGNKALDENSTVSLEVSFSLSADTEPADQGRYQASSLHLVEQVLVHQADCVQP